MLAVGFSSSRKVRSKESLGSHGGDGARNGEGGRGFESKYFPP
jgi:hypothetical protein